MPGTTTSSPTTPAAGRKAYWAAMPDECFEALTFGELSVGDLFIFLPAPGDNDGHGGFKGTHNIFKKTDVDVLARSGLPYRFPMGCAMNVHRNVPSDIQHSMAVLRLQ